MIETIKGNHSIQDKKILVTANKEAISLKDFFNLLELLCTNELKRIRSEKVRRQIINEDRPFYFTSQIKTIIQQVKADELKALEVKE